MYINLLFVEDDQDFIKIATLWLMRCQKIVFNISRANTMNEALLLSASTSVDVILADLNLADSSGSETINKLRKQSPSVPIVVLSASVDDHLIDNVLMEGAHDFISKFNCDSSRLIWTILQSIGRQFQSPSRAGAPTAANSANGINAGLTQA